MLADPWVGKIPWRRERLPTPAFWPGEFHGLYSPWGHKELDTTERLSLTHSEQGSIFVPRSQQGEDTAKETEEGKCQGMLMSSRNISFSPFNFLTVHMLPPLFFLYISLSLYERC